MITPLRLSHIAQLCRGQLHGPDVSVSSVAIDSRQHLDGGLFVALPGEKVDGHDFVAAAAANGAAAALVTRPSDDLPCVCVDDAYLAIADIARENRRQFSRPVVALTGSSGKTSTKEILAALLSERGAVLATAGNYNNELGVPLTLLRLSADHDFAVVEMGAAKAGDIRYLCDIARPDIAILTNAQPAHIQGFGSLDGVARTKGEIFEALPAEGLAVINADDAYFQDWYERASHCRRISFSVQSPAADLFASDIVLEAGGSRFTLNSPSGRVEVSLSLPGRHMIANALAASAVALELGVSLAELAAALGRVSNAAGRLSRQVLAGVTLIDDSYNANPGSVRAAVEVLASEAGERCLVLGTMAELGATAAEQHQAIARYAAQAGIQQLIAVGDFAEDMAQAFGSGGYAFADNQALIEVLKQQIQGLDAVLVKGSRSAAMERVVQAIQQQLSGENS